MQAIQVRYLQATANHGIRLKAFCEVGSITQGRDYAFNSSEQAKDVAEALATKYGWLEHCDMAQGQIKNGDYVFVLTSRHNPDA